MIAIDTNILVYAHREGFPQHARALERLRAIARGGIPWAIPVFCIAEFCRVVTHPRVLSPPTDLDTALSVIDSLLRAPAIRLLLPGNGFAGHFATCARDGDAKGNLIFDAQIAAICREHGVRELLTSDRDFTRFRDIRILTL